MAVLSLAFPLNSQGKRRIAHANASGRRNAQPIRSVTFAASRFIALHQKLQRQSKKIQNTLFVPVNAMSAHAQMFPKDIVPTDARASTRQIARSAEKKCTCAPHGSRRIRLFFVPSHVCTSSAAHIARAGFGQRVKIPCKNILRVSVVGCANPKFCMFIIWTAIVRTTATKI